MSKVQAFVVGIILLLIFSIVFMPYYSDIPLFDQAGYFLCAGGLVFFVATNMIFDTLFFTHSPSNSNELDPTDTTKSNGSSENSAIKKIITYNSIGDKTGNKDGIIISLIAALVSKSTSFP